jgi:hypothetical protein
VHYKQPEVNWGSAAQAQVYVDALRAAHKLSRVRFHVKNYRPQFLVLVNTPQFHDLTKDTGAIVRFARRLGKSGGGMIAFGSVVSGTFDKEDEDTVARRAALVRDARDWLNDQSIDAFIHVLVADSVRSGGQSLMQVAGLGGLAPNTLLLGFDESWIKTIVTYREEEKKRVAAEKEEEEEEERAGGSVAVKRVRPSARRAGRDGLSDWKPGEYVGLLSDAFDLRLGAVVVRGLTQLNDRGDAPPSGRNRVDVYWLVDDGGLTILLPHLLVQSSSWKSSSLRLIAAPQGSADLDAEQVRMARLVAKFRIKADVLVVPDRSKPPKQSTVEEYNEILREAQIRPSKSEKRRCLRFVRLAEIMRRESRDAALIVVSMPVPPANTDPNLYMSWLDMLTRDLPPCMLVRGPQQSVISYYS